MGRPEVSVVILSKNGGEPVKKCLHEISKQQEDITFELIIVDSGSTDGTLSEIKKYPCRLFQVRPEDFKFGPTRDLGFSKARGDIIVTLSQDAIPCDEYWLHNLITPFNNPSIVVVQGIEISPTSPDVFFWERKGGFYFTSEHKRWLDQYGGIGLSCVNVAIRRDIWQKYRFGDVPMSEDKVLQKKLTENGHRVYLAKDAKVYHGHSYTVRSLIKRCENEGLGWRYADVAYSLWDAWLDILGYRKYIVLLKGLLNGEVRRMSEVLFPLIRPIFLYRGNRFSKGFKF